MNSSRVGEHSHDSATLASERTRKKPFPLRPRLPTFQWYYFSRVFWPCSLASKLWCIRDLQAYLYSSSYCHMAFERNPIVVLCMKPPGKTTNLCILTCLSKRMEGGLLFSALADHCLMPLRIRRGLKL